MTQSQRLLDKFDKILHEDLTPAVKAKVLEILQREGLISSTPPDGPPPPNTAKCAQCYDIIESKHRHDYVTCHCGAISLDGGNDYWRVCAKDFNDVLRLIDGEWRAPYDDPPDDPTVVPDLKDFPDPQYRIFHRMCPYCERSSEIRVKVEDGCIHIVSIERE